MLDLGINLISSRRICKTKGLQGSFNSKNLYFKQGNRKVISIKMV